MTKLLEFLKYWQDRTNAGFNSDGTANVSPAYGFEVLRFTGDPATGGSLDIRGGSLLALTPTSGPLLLQV